METMKNEAQSPPQLHKTAPASPAAQSMMRSVALHIVIITFFSSCHSNLPLSSIHKKLKMVCLVKKLCL